MQSVTSTNRTWHGAVRVYVRPDGHYTVREDRAGSGLILGSPTDHARVAWGQPDDLGETVLAMLGRSMDGGEQPTEQREIAARGRAFRQPLVELAGLDSWESFVSEAMLVSVRRDTSRSIRVSPMRRVRDRRWGFLPTGTIIEVDVSEGPRSVGEAIESAASASGFGPN